MKGAYTNLRKDRVGGALEGRENSEHIGGISTLGQTSLWGRTGGDETEGNEEEEEGD